MAEIYSATTISLDITKKLLKDFLDHLLYEKRVADHTATAYLSDLWHMVDFWIKEEKASSGAKFLQEIVKKFAMSLFYNKELNAKSIARKVSSLKSFQKYLSRIGLSLDISIKNPKTQKKLPAVAETSDLLFLLDQLPDQELGSALPMRDKAILEVLYSTGARCNELVNIKSKDIDFSERFIKICQGKGGKERLVIYGKAAEYKIEKYLRLERFKQDPSNSNEYLFLNSSGSRLTTRSIQRILENFKRFLPVGKELSPHTLRHSFATHMLSAGACIRVVQELLGHSNLLTTELYTQISQTEMTKFLNENHPLQDFKKKDFEDDDKE